MVLATQNKIKPRRRRTGIKTLSAAALRVPVMLTLALIAAASCQQGRKVDVAASLNPKNMATMTTKNVSTLISDSGIVQYKIVSPLWQIYDQRDTPCWTFPKGLYLRKYDRNYKEIASIAADSAHYFKNQRIWRLDGNVEIKRTPGQLFLTQQLFWNEREHRLYSDSFIHIETATHILEGYGFVSNDQITDYRILKPSGVFPFSHDISAGGAPSQAMQASPDIRPAKPGA